MRLRALTGLEREKIEQEYAELMAKIAEFKAILADEKLLLGVIRKEIAEIADKYGDDRRTSIGFDEDDFTDEDLIPNELTVIAMTKLGYIKRMTIDNFKSQHRGGKGIKGMQTIEDDFIEELFMTKTHHHILFFTNKGRVYRIKGYEIPEASRTARGTAIINLLQLMPEEKVTAIITLKEFDDERYLFMTTKSGIVKKTKIKDYANIRKTGLIAMNLREDDELIEVKATNGEKDIILVTKYGMCIRFNEKDVRSTGRASMGVIGMTLDDGDEIVAMQMNTQGDHLLTVSENGYGKRTEIDEFKVQHRGGKGVKCYNIMEKTGNLVGAKAVTPGQEIMIITNAGIIIRITVDDISILGRITSGVKLINMDTENDIHVASFTKVKESEGEGAMEQLERDMQAEDEEVVVEEDVSEEQEE